MFYLRCRHRSARRAQSERQWSAVADAETPVWLDRFVHAGHEALFPAFVFNLNAVELDITLRDLVRDRSVMATITL